MVSSIFILLPREFPLNRQTLILFLLGLIKALRANKGDEAGVVQQALEETRKEIKKKDIEVKAAAVLKLVYVGDELS